MFAFGLRYLALDDSIDTEKVVTMPMGVYVCAALIIMSMILSHSLGALSGMDDPDAPEVTHKHECRYVLKMERGVSLDLHTHNFTQFKGHHHYCMLQVTADRNLRIVLDLVYSPASLSGTSAKLDCETDYVHVGNDVGRVDVNLMTSYRFCAEDVRHELISKSNHLWVVLKATRRPREFVVKLRAQPEVTCSSSQFSCSPVQCVKSSFTCDGFKDCRNGRDEFCHKTGMTHNGAVLSDPCFRCGDGTCIQPRLLRSDVSYGRALWYLCDGYAHCPDAWDERKEKCSKRSQSGRVGAVTECVPSDLQFGHNGSVLMWNDIRCNDIEDCFHGDDENNCNADNQGSKLRADPATLGAVIGVLITACTVICVTYRLKMVMKHTSRPSTSSTVDTRCTQCTSGDSERAEAALTEPGCSEGFPVSDDVAGPSIDEGNTCAEADHCSLTSLTLKHTVV